MSDRDKIPPDRLAAIIAYNRARAVNRAKGLRLDALRPLLLALLAMWDGLGAISRATVTRLLPDLAAKIEQIREAMRDDE